MKKSLLIACLLGLGGTSVALAHGPHGRFGRMDADGDGKVTLAEMQKTVGDHFAKLDANGDGRVDKNELASFGEQMRAQHENERGARIEKHFAGKDADRDGKLSRQEVARMPQPFFDRLDANKDGYLTKDEFAAKASAMREHAGKWFAKRGAEEFTRADTNGDGAVDQKELQASVAQRFAKLDANHDGVLAADELRHGRGDCGEGSRAHHGFGPGHGRGEGATGGTAGSGAEQ